MYKKKSSIFWLMALFSSIFLNAGEHEIIEMEEGTDEKIAHLDSIKSHIKKTEYDKFVSLFNDSKSERLSYEDFQSLKEESEQLIKHLKKKKSQYRRLCIGCVAIALYSFVRFLYDTVWICCDDNYGNSDKVSSDLFIDLHVSILGLYGIAIFNQDMGVKDYWKSDVQKKKKLIQQKASERFSEKLNEIE